MKNPSATMKRCDSRNSETNVYERSHQNLKNSKTPPSGYGKPDFLSAEIWLLQGGKCNTKAVSDSTVNVDSQHIEPQNSLRMRSPKKEQREQRGRSPNHRGTSTSKRSSTTSPQKLPIHHSSNKRNTLVGSERPQSTFEIPTESPPPCPIPTIYITHIRKAFGSTSPINLYVDVLGLSPSQKQYTDTQIRVAYFRKGRLVLQHEEPHQSSPNSTMIHDNPSSNNNNSKIIAKQKFQAITKAYEIVTNPTYKAYYDVYGLPPLKPDAPTLDDIRAISPSTSASIVDHVGSKDTVQAPTRDISRTLKKIEKKEAKDDDDDVDSVASIGSILRKCKQRSQSCGPSIRQRVVWKEVVQELIYQPDPPSNQSMEMIEQQYKDRLEPSQMDLYNAFGPNAGDVEQEDRDFFDDLEASVDGLGSTIGNFVNDLTNLYIDVKMPDETKGCIENDQQIQNIDDRSCDSSQVARQLFDDLTRAPTPIETKAVDPSNASAARGGGNGAYAKRIADHRRSRSCDETKVRENHKNITTSMAPLKEGKTDQKPRTKPKKSKSKKRVGVDKVPSHMPPPIYTRHEKECLFNVNDDVFDPFQNSMDASIDFGAVDPLVELWKQPKNDCLYDPATYNSISNNDRHHETNHDPYDLPEASSILASLDGGKRSVQQGTAATVGSEKSLSFDDALNRTTDATTKGYICLDRRAHSLSDVVENTDPVLNVSDITFSSKMSDDPAGRHFHGLFASLAQSAKVTIKEIASFDDENDDKDTTAVGNKDVASSTKADPTKITTKGKDDDIMSKLSSFMESFVSDINKFGEQISINISEANRVVHETMTFQEAEVSGLLERIGTGLSFAKSVDQTESDLHQSFTY
jgi:curved DNA-binding protein CbpA